MTETLLEKAENAIIFFKLPFEQPDFCIIFCSLHELHVQCTQIYKKLMHCKCISIKEQKQCTKKVVSNILGLVDFAIGLVNSVLNLPDGQVIFWGSSNDFLGRQCALFNIDGPRCGSIPISTILQKSVRFFIINVRKSVSIYSRSTLESHMKFSCSCTTCSSIEPASKFAQSLKPKELLTQVHLWKFFELLLQACSSFQHMFVLSLP